MAEKHVAMPKSLPILPVRDTVLFPGAVLPLTVGRESSLALIAALQGEDKFLGVVAQHDPRVEDPAAADLHKVGTFARVHKTVKMPNGNVVIFLEGLQRFQVNELLGLKPFLTAQVEPMPDIYGEQDNELEALHRNAQDLFRDVVGHSPQLSDDLQGVAANIDDSGRLADFIAGTLPALSTLVRQELLETANVRKRLESLIRELSKELEVLELRSKIHEQVQEQVSQNQREYLLREQMKAIQKELGEQDDSAAEIDELRKKVEEAGMTAEAKKECDRELKRLAKMTPASAEYMVSRTYLEWMTSLPWSKSSGTNAAEIDIKKAHDILNEDHYDLEKVKERILDYLAVKKLQPGMKGPILCFVGPPGVGKTSLGKSIARAMGRKFVRISLGGMHDEAEIRGHRRTYIGALPGQIIQGLKRAESNDPVCMLDEVDKLGRDFRGDPSAALMEVLDPEQNATFMDHYLEVEYDLSNVMFVTTANTLNIPPALMDRMEIIRIAGYTEQEKLEIAKRHLLPKAMENHGLDKKEFELTEPGIMEVIRRYTREAGVRNLEREINSLARKAIKDIMLSKNTKKRIKATPDVVEKYLGVPKFRHGEIEREDQVGLVTGLAWTEVGGELLTVEGVMMPGKGKMTVTGNLRDVMKESISAASSYVRSRATDFGLKPPVFDKKDIHVHVPEGATPKDGPSAGVAMVSAIVSVMTGIPVRKDVAMTGEITLRGRVLPIGGLKEKLLAALRAGIKKVMIPEENAKDLADLPDNVKNSLELVPVSRMEEVLRKALVRMPEPITWEEDKNAPPPVVSGDDAGAVVAH